MLIQLNNNTYKLNAKSDKNVETSPVNVTDDREACSKFWVAVYTRSKAEKKLSESLNRAGIETYTPIQRQTRQWSDRKKTIDVVIIPTIIFAKIENSDISKIREQQHFIRILSYPGSKNPAHIPNEQIDRLRFMLERSEENVEFVSNDFNVFDKVRIMSGNLSGLEGTVERTADGKTYVTITIDLLGGAKVAVDSSILKLL